MTREQQLLAAYADRRSPRIDLSQFKPCEYKHPVQGEVTGARSGESRRRVHIFSIFDVVSRSAKRVPLALRLFAIALVLLPLVLKVPDFLAWMVRL